ncbi:hypothetical protein IFM89_035100 [Coptis chinensis]|uniref:Myb-like domain-containing protein n=1 Tax=Coptis chinensis TaxID=261450 RepID=A0A835IKB6_9MAGN|nr:hypothetical protein IFM89_035100 [Coptis chinensis]
MNYNRLKKNRACRTASNESEEVTSTNWEDINMTEQEEDLIVRMHRLVGDWWAMIAGRIPDRTPNEIERFWIMRVNNYCLREGTARPET